MADSANRFSLAALTLAVMGIVGTGAASPASVTRSSHPNVLADIPAFARKYRTGCSTCHTAAPKLNVLGEAFRLNGYKFPENDALLRRDEPVPLGADPWKDLWPRAIWPGELPGGVPIAVGLRSDIQYTRDPDAGATWDFLFPEELYIVAGSSLGQSVSAYLSTEWTPGEGVEVDQAKVELQDLVPGLPARAVNLWIGFQKLYPLTFADRYIDGAARQGFMWQSFRASDLDLVNPATGESVRSSNDFRLRHSQAAIEINGLGAGRFYYGLGVSQGASGLSRDNNARKDFFYKLRYKLGGLRLDGRYDSAGVLPEGAGGQLLDKTLTVEHFGYFGAEPVEGGRQDTHQSFGVSARARYGRADLGLGFVWGTHENPWGDIAAGELSHSSLFAKGEYLVYPWLIGSLKFETFDADVPTEIRVAGYSEGSADQTRLLPGVIALLRQNVRAVVEAELFTEHALNASVGKPRPHSLWFRLEVAY